jgi:Ca-activated chloride channel family protein
MMRLLLLLLLVLVPLPALADAGVLIPKDQQAPDPAILSLEEMSVRIVIDSGDAHIAITQIFANHSGHIEEGTYRFSLPSGSTVSDFAVWDGPIRIPAVILERKRAQEVYDQARMQALDPGLLQMGERDDSDPRSSAIFTAKIVPIPAYGTKRLELEYHQRLTASDFNQFFALPLRPDASHSQTAHRFKLLLELHSAHPILNVQAPSKLYPLTFSKRDPNTIAASFEAVNLTFAEDFQVTWTLDPQAVDQLELITHRDLKAPLPTSGETAPAKPPVPAKTPAPEPGFFQAQVLIGEIKPSQPAPVAAPRTLLLLFDTSLSMQWEKLERSYAALTAILQSLSPADRFNVILFNQDVTSFQSQPVQASPATVQRALDFVRSKPLRGGTDLLHALDAALKQSTAPNTSLILLTDGGSDRGETILPRRIAAQYAEHWKQTPHPPHTNVFAVGDDANLPLLRQLARNDGILEQVLSTEPYDFKLKSFIAKLTHTPVTGLSLTSTDSAAVSFVYPLDDAVYPGSFAQWIGQYKPRPEPLALTVRGVRNAAPFEVKASTPLPAVDPAHPQLPRIWARARVNALIEKIDRDGETAAAIDEIIRLSRRYKFATPYTSFLAVPRSLLRPRVIRPGDPVLRVRTDPAITSVIALFPFGLTKPLRHLRDEDSHAPTIAQRDEANELWETRFLAPPDMKDGTYTVRLILRDTHGNTYREAKTFVIASTPPTVKLQLARTRLHRGESLELRASASSGTRSLIAHLEGAGPVSLRWNPAAQANTGILTVPATLPIGRYTLTVTAEDVAHNLGTQEVQVDVLP